jgi:large subunit ribosomal protein L9
MKVLLLQDVDRLGKMGETVEVREGYARNFLLPKRLACKPGGAAGKELELAKRRAKRMEQKLITEAEAVKKELAKVSWVTLELRANETGALYGSVTPSMIVDALRTHRLKIDAKQVEIKSPIKNVGDFEIPIRLYKDVVHNLKVKVIATAEVKVEEKKSAGETEEKVEAEKSE